MKSATSSRATEDPTAATNPCLLIEVTSTSTEDYDRGKKLESYKLLPTLREVLIVSHRRPWLVVHRRGASGAWTVTEAGVGETLELSALGGKLSVDEVYRDRLEEPG